MKLVRVKGIGVQVKGISYFKNDTFNVTEDDYEPIKELVEVLEEDKLQEDTRSVVIKVEDESIDLKEVEKYLYECLNNFGKLQAEIEDPKEPKAQEDSDEEDGEDEELEALKDRAKELDIKVTANMKKETIIKKIEEAEKAKEEQSQNPDGE